MFLNAYSAVKTSNDEAGSRMSIINITVTTYTVTQAGRCSERDESFNDVSYQFDEVPTPR